MQVLLNELREDSNAKALLQLTRDDAAKGRMSEPVPVQSTDLSKVLLNPRFGAEKVREDGSKKLRAIDHLSWSPGCASEGGAVQRPSKKARKEHSVNGHTMASEKMRHDTLDVLAATLRKFVDVVGHVPGLLKVCC